MANKYPEPTACQAYQCRVKVALGYQVCQSSGAFYRVFWSLQRVFQSLVQGLPEPSMADKYPEPAAYQACQHRIKMA